MSRRDLLLVAPDIFDREGGIARIARATSYACQMICAERGWKLTALALHDTGRKRDERYLPGAADYFGFSGDRRRLALALLPRALGPRHLGTVFCHINLASLGLLYLPRDRSLRRSYSVVAHGVDVWSPLPVHRRLALRQAYEVWPVSTFTGRMVSDLHGVSPKQVRVIHNCLDPFWVSARLHQEQPPVRRVLCVARLTHADRYKGVDDLITAFALAAGRAPGLRLTIVGEGDDRPRLQNLAATGPVSDRIDFYGRVGDEQLQHLYRTCDIFALPSQKEGFGLVFLEAMACGKAVIAAASAAAPEVVVDGSTGLLVPYGDIGRLTLALIQLLTDKVAAQRMGERGNLRWSDQFSFSLYKRKIEAALDGMTGESIRTLGPRS